MKKTQQLDEKKAQMSEYNLELFEKYEKYLPNNSSKTQIISIISRILVFANKRKIEEIPKQEIVNYLWETSTPGANYNTKISRLKTYIKYLLDNKFIESYDYRDFDKYRISKKDIDDNPAEPLSPYQIVKSRKILQQNSFLLMMFELFYEYSLTWDELDNFKKIYNFNERVLTKSNEKIRVKLFFIF